ncbi:ABC transporter permease [Kocuria coralli]|uniref:ABC transporter permease n=1 Tax=Kocuria coralli TaxID=1461025 RepID=A0A5J5KWS6_9MICC|nr:ABC transporter permease [Kocuria coralli]KAA9394119.1 ABC transporter permease [Kocuria coralli]
MTTTANAESTAETTNRSGLRVDRGSLRSLILYPVILLAILGLLILWLLTADLTNTERVTLAPGELWTMTKQHLWLTLVATVIVLVVAIPLGVLLTRKPFRPFKGFISGVANFGQAAPAVGLIVLFATWIGYGPTAAIAALVVYAVLPVLANTMAGLDAVDKSLIEAGRGMGMSAWAVLWRIELPLAVPLMLAGVRTALVLVVGTATLGTFINAGGLGLLITTGVNLDLSRVLITGSILVALLALTVDWVGRVVEHIARPRGL